MNRLLPLLLVIKILVLPALAAAQCCEITDRNRTETILNCPGGHQAKVRNNGEDSAALLMLKGAFDSSDFEGQFLRYNSVVKVVGKVVDNRKRGGSEITVFATRSNGAITWIVSQLDIFSKRNFVSASFAPGMCQEIRGRLEFERILEKTGIKIVSEELSAATTDAVLEKLGFASAP